MKKTIATFSVTLTLLSLSLASSFVSPFVNSLALAQPSPEVGLPTDTLSFRQLFRRIFRGDEQSDPPTTSRGGFCLIAPARPGETYTVWHQRPVFVWQGSIGRLEVVDERTDEVLWDYAPSAADETFVVYDGEPLRAGGTYRWRVYSEADSAADSEAPTAFPAFEVMSTVRQKLVANGLAAAESRQVASEEERVLARTQYFVDRGLPLDALQSLFLVEEADVALEEARSELLESLCE